MLQIEHLTKKFGEKTAVDDLSLHIAPGEVYGFIGHNGAGKTTTLRSVVGIQQFDAGTVRIDGISLQDDPIACKRRLAYIPDNPDLYDFMTGIKYLNFVADIFGKGDLEEVIREKIRKLGLEKKVVLHGEISYQQMQIQYQQSDIFVLPSLRETTGTVVMEAMANKLPVVAMKQNGVKYLVGDDVGILVDIRSKEQVLRDLGEAVARLIDDPDLRRDLGERGYKKIREQYTWSERVRQMDSVYRKLSEQYDMTTWIKGR